MLKSFIMTVICLTNFPMSFAEGIKGKINIPVEIKEAKTSFTKRLSQNGPELRFEMYGKFTKRYLNEGHIDVFNVTKAKRIQKIRVLS